MAHKVIYEWIVEHVDEYGDIQDVWHFDTLAEARTQTPHEGLRIQIALRRDVIDTDDFDGTIDRQYAYSGATKFEYGAAIPKRLMAQFKLL